MNFNRQPTKKIGNNYQNRSIDQTTVDILSKVVPDSQEDKVFGCVLGAFVGDSCGSFVEFSEEMIKDDMMDLCMQMPGGGPHTGIQSG